MSDDLTTSPIIPRPLSVTARAGRFLGTVAEARVRIDPGAADELGDEGYRLDVTTDGIVIDAATAAGAHHARQTLRQLVDLDSSEGVHCGTIVDRPTYAYRGVMLDVARHFFPVADVERLIELLARYKINHLHLHLTDDQGWRIEIDGRPELTRIGGATQVGGGPGGFYTRDDYRRIVAFAAERQVTIVPEVDLPGHTNAALAACPELNANGVAATPYTGIEVGFSSLLTDDDVTRDFVRDIVVQLAALTPGPFLHIGGDEAHATDPEAYVRFVEWLQEVVTSTGKRMVGWEEIGRATLEPGSVAQYWRRRDPARAAARQGASVIASPARRVYLDMKYDESTPIGLDWAGLIEVDHAYDWDPVALFGDIEPERILGVEAPLWTETVETMADVEYLVFPRAIGLAEIGWTPAELRTWDDHRRRLAAHGPLLDAMGVRFHRSPTIDW